MYTIYWLESLFFCLTIKEDISVFVVPFSLVARNDKLKNTAVNL